VAVGLGLIGTIRAGYWDVSDAHLWARYGENASLRVVDGVALRIKDEGHGPVVFLLHGAFGTLNTWDAWTRELARGHRVIRFDDPPEGLSGPDPSGQFGHDRTGELVIRLADELRIQDFALAGTSRGGVVAYRLAAKYPQRVTRLILVSTPILPQTAPKLPWLLSAATFWDDTILAGYRTRWHERIWLGWLYDDPSRLTDEMVREWADFYNRSGRSARLRMVSAGSKRDMAVIRALLGSIVAPTLIIATAHDPALDAGQAEALKSMLTASESKLSMLPVGGHFPHVEFGEETARLAAEFLDAPKPTER
jgi:pimeloyl-ACP methyl ester carboxylesterase